MSERIPHVPRDNDERSSIGIYRRHLNRALNDWAREYTLRQEQSYVPAGDGPPTRVPGQRADFVSLYFDRTAQKLYVYTAAGWIASAAFT